MDFLVACDYWIRFFFSFIHYNSDDFVPLQPIDIGKIGHHLYIQYTAPNLTRPNCWSDCSEVIKKRSVFKMTFRWHCAETIHVAPGHAWYNTHQVWSESTKALRRNSHTSIFVRNSQIHFTRTVWSTERLLRTFFQHLI